MDENFKVVVENAWGAADYDEWQVVIRRDNVGNVIQPFFRSRKRAERVAAALHKILLPEFLREEAEQQERMEAHRREMAARPKPKPFKPTKKMPRISVEKCGACEELYEPGDEGEAVYECSRCGQTQVGERRCENCHTFMTKTSDSSCPHCEAALDEVGVSDTLAVRDDNEQLHEVPAEEEPASITCKDGTRFVLMSEQVRGERRFYWPEVGASSQPTHRIPGEGSYRRQTALRQLRRLADDHEAKL